jgi:hypothetical protein
MMVYLLIPTSSLKETQRLTSHSSEVYTHILNRGGRGALSSADQL